MKKKVFSFILASLLLLVQLPTALAAAPTDPLALDNIYTEASNVINIAIQQGIVPGLSDGEISDLYRHCIKHGNTRCCTSILFWLD